MVYGSGLENQRVFTGTVGSNPTLSALKTQSLTGFFSVLPQHWSRSFACGQALAEQLGLGHEITFERSETMLRWVVYALDQDQLIL